MPDFPPRNGTPREEPRNWSDAFAALPLETPPRDAWAQIAAELGAATPQRQRRPLWLAIAAAVALAIALPLAWLPRDGETPPAVAVQPSSDAPIASPGGSQVSDPAPTPASESARVALAPTPTKPGPQAATTPTSEATSLAALYAQSEQLENLLARMRDERMSSGPAAALADQLETRVAVIDAGLTEPTLDDTQRAGLWRQRVDALQQLAGIESTQRWLAAQGESYDARLLAVY